MTERPSGNQRQHPTPLEGENLALNNAPSYNEMMGRVQEMSDYIAKLDPLGKHKDLVGFSKALERLLIINITEDNGNQEDRQSLMRKLEGAVRGKAQITEGDLAKIREIVSRKKMHVVRREVMEIIRRREIEEGDSNVIPLGLIQDVDSLFQATFTGALNAKRRKNILRDNNSDLVEAVVARYRAKGSLPREIYDQISQKAVEVFSEPAAHSDVEMIARDSVHNGEMTSVIPASTDIAYINPDEEEEEPKEQILSIENPLTEPDYESPYAVERPSPDKESDSEGLGFLADYYERSGGAPKVENSEVTEPEKKEERESLKNRRRFSIPSLRDRKRVVKSKRVSILAERAAKRAEEAKPVVKPVAEPVLETTPAPVQVQKSVWRLLEEKQLEELMDMLVSENKEAQHFYSEIGDLLFECGDTAVLARVWGKYRDFLVKDLHFMVIMESNEAIRGDKKLKREIDNYSKRQPLLPFSAEEMDRLAQTGGSVLKLERRVGQEEVLTEQLELELGDPSVYDGMTITLNPEAGIALPSEELGEVTNVYKKPKLGSREMVEFIELQGMRYLGKNDYSAAIFYLADILLESKEAIKSQGEPLNEPSLADYLNSGQFYSSLIRILRHTENQDSIERACEECAGLIIEIPRLMGAVEFNPLFAELNLAERFFAKYKVQDDLKDDGFSRRKEAKLLGITKEYRRLGLSISSTKKLHRLVRDKSNVYRGLRASGEAELMDEKRDEVLRQRFGVPQVFIETEEFQGRNLIRCLDAWIDIMQQKKAVETIKRPLKLQGEEAENVAGLIINIGGVYRSLDSNKEGVLEDEGEARDIILRQYGVSEVFMIQVQSGKWNLREALENLRKEAVDGLRDQGIKVGDLVFNKTGIDKLRAAIGCSEGRLNKIFNFLANAPRTYQGMRHAKMGVDDDRTHRNAILTEAGMSRTFLSDNITDEMSEVDALRFWENTLVQWLEYNGVKLDDLFDGSIAQGGVIRIQIPGLNARQSAQARRLLFESKDILEFLKKAEITRDHLSRWGVPDDFVEKCSTLLRQSENQILELWIGELNRRVGEVAKERSEFKIPKARAKEVTLPKQSSKGNEMLRQGEGLVERGEFKKAFAHLKTMISLTEEKRYGQIRASDFYEKLVGRLSTCPSDEIIELCEENADDILRTSGLLEAIASHPYFNAFNLKEVLQKNLSLFGSLPIVNSLPDGGKDLKGAFLCLEAELKKAEEDYASDEIRHKLDTRSLQERKTEIISRNTRFLELLRTSTDKESIRSIIAICRIGADCIIENDQLRDAILANPKARENGAKFRGRLNLNKSNRVPYITPPMPVLKGDSTNPAIKNKGVAVLGPKSVITAKKESGVFMLPHGLAGAFRDEQQKLFRADYIRESGERVNLVQSMQMQEAKVQDRVNAAPVPSVPNAPAINSLVPPAPPALKDTNVITPPGKKDPVTPIANDGSEASIALDLDSKAVEILGDIPVVPPPIPKAANQGVTTLPVKKKRLPQPGDIRKMKKMTSPPPLPVSRKKAEASHVARGKVVSLFFTKDGRRRVRKALGAFRNALATD